MLRRLTLLVAMLLVCSLYTNAQDRNLKQLFQETERDSLWVRDLVINCYIHYIKDNKLDSLAILSDIAVNEANRLNFPWGQYHGNQLKGEPYRNEYPDSTIHYIKLGISYLPKENLSTLNDAYFNLGRAYWLFNRHDSALHYLEKIIPNAEELDDQVMIGDTYRLMGIVAKNMGNSSLAIANYIKAANLGEALGDSALISDSYMALGVAYDNLQDFEKGLDYMLRSAVLQEAMVKSRLQEKVDSNLLNNIGRMHCKLGNYEEGMKFLYRDINQFEKLQDDPCHNQYPAYNLGNAHLQLGTLDSAQYYLQAAIDMSKGCRNDYVLSLAAHDLGQLMDQKGDARAAKQLFEQALKAAEAREAPSNELINAAYRLYEMSRAERDYKTATQYLQLWGVAKDSLFNLDKSNQITRLEMEYDFDRQKREIVAAQEKEQLILENELERRTIFQYALLAVALLILLIALNFYRSNQRRKKANEIIRQQNADLSASAGQIRQLSNFKEGMIGMIAHDMKNSLNTILGLSKSGQKVDGKKANSIQVAGANILNLVSNMLDVQKFEEAKVSLNKEYSLMSSIMGRVKESLEPLLQAKSMVLVDETSTITSLNVDPEIIHRVFINLVTNSVKYSTSGSRVHIRANADFEGPEPKALISVIDEGAGVDEQFLPNLFDKFTQSKARSLGNTGSSGLGLHFCKLAIEAHGGEIRAASKAGEGLTISFSIPVEKQNLSTNQITGEIKENGQAESAVTTDMDDELTLVQPYLTQFRTLKVYQIMQVKAIIARMEEEGVRTQWQKDLWTATLNGNQEMFDSLVNRN